MRDAWDKDGASSGLEPSSTARLSPAGPILPGMTPTPCPELLTEDEAIRYLRLDTIRGLRNPDETLARYRATGLLRGTQVSKSLFYRRVELDRFLERLTNENPR
ncbi:MAG: helix-turn-helix domain-containing protein [Planctomycetes bacterium]|nr:helix-turn-helix domain-containing protein [Planctomycetota bacterium]MBI3833138.1 helix-turn-helix domain-containing protein [Planctomycetota bacterium]